MVKIRNISRGPRGAYVKGKGDKAALTEVWAEPGEEIEADDYDETHFAPADSDEARAFEASSKGAMALGRLVLAAVDAGVFTEAEFREDIAKAIEARKPAAADEGEGDDDEPDAPTDDEIKAAVASLDAKNDDHWTKGGEPGVDAINEILEAKVTRADIKRAAPDAVRPKEAE